MYPISNAVKSMFDNNIKQVIRITCNPVSGTSFTLTENDIIAGSFTIDRYSITGQRIEVGTAVAAEMKFRMKNYSGEWTGKKFEGCEMYVRIGIADWTQNPTEQQINFIPCGYFTVDKPVKNSHILEIVALDRMAKFDRFVDKTTLSVSYTPTTMVNYVCTQCGVLLANGSDMNNFPNKDYICQIPENVEELTYRNLLQSACMLMGVNAFIDWQGQLRLKWYSHVSAVSSEHLTYTVQNRYSHTIQENNVQITGVFYDYTDDERVTTRYISGTDDYAVDISENPLVKSDTIQTAVNALAGALVGFAYRPLTMVTKPSPYIYPMDMFDFVTKDNVTVTGIVSKVAFGINANTAIESDGETNEDNGYASYGTLTEVQSRIVEKARRGMNTVIDERTQYLLALNEMLTNSLGLYVITEPTQGGGVQYYFADANDLDDATIIYTFNANGFAWTDDWNDGSPVWQYGITRDGNAVINMLSAYKISADYITAGTMQAVNLIFGTTPNTTELRTNDASTGALFKGQGVMQFETVGHFRAQNKVSLSGNVANEIYLWRDNSNSTLRLMNKSYDGAYDANRIVMWTPSSGGASISVANYERINSADTYANRVYLQQTASANQVFIQNYSLVDGVLANQIGLLVNSGDAEKNISLQNYQKVNDHNVYANRINSIATDSENKITLENYASGINKVANTLILQNNSSQDASWVHLINNDRQGNTLRSALYMYDGPSSQFFSLGNYQGSVMRNLIKGNLESNNSEILIQAADYQGNVVSQISCKSDGYLYIKAGGLGAFKCGFRNVNNMWVLAAL